MKAKFFKAMHVIAIAILVIVIVLIATCSGLKNAGNMSSYQSLNEVLKYFVVGGMIFCIPYSMVVLSNNGQAQS